jgi:hypothetical protein
MKTEKQLTAVEWLCNEWLYLDQQFDMCLIDRNIYWDKLRQIQEQAKEMENERLKEAYSMGRLGKSIKEFNETFKQQEQ